MVGHGGGGEALAGVPVGGGTYGAGAGAQRVAGEDLAAESGFVVVVVAALPGGSAVLFGAAAAGGAAAVAAGAGLDEFGAAGGGADSFGVGHGVTLG